MVYGLLSAGFESAFKSAPMDAHKNLGIRSAVAVLLLTPLAHNCEILTCHAAAARASPDVLVEIGAVLAKWLNVVASLSAIFGGIGSGPACEVAKSRFARRFRQANRRRNRKVGQGGQVRRYEAGVIRQCVPIRYGS